MSYPNKYTATSFPSKGVLHVELNRPKLLNAVHRPAYLEYHEVFRRAAADPEVRAIVLSGAGRALTAGLDVAGMAAEFGGHPSGEASRSAIALGTSIREFQAAISFPYVMNKPVIAVAHGPCIGLAIDILTAADVRFASRDAVFSVREIELGMAADIGTLQRLPKVVGNMGWVKDICFSGRDFGGDEALAQGFVQRVLATKDEAVAAAVAYAAELAAKSPVALQGTKRALNYATDHTHAEALEQIADYNSFALGDDFSEGAMAMLESIRTKKKVRPTYPNL